MINGNIDFNYRNVPVIILPSWHNVTYDIFRLLFSRPIHTEWYLLFDLITEGKTKNLNYYLYTYKQCVLKGQQTDIFCSMFGGVAYTCTKYTILFLNSLFRLSLLSTMAWQIKLLVL